MKVKKMAENYKKKILICGLVIVVLVAGYANIRLTSFRNDNAQTQVNANAEGMVEDASANAEAVSSEEYFAVFRAEREETRTQEMGYIDAIISSNETDDETKKEAEQQKLDLVSYMEQELTTEGLIRTKLNMDAVVTIKDGAVSAVVAQKELSSDEVAQIADIVKTQTGQPVQNIKIMPQS